MKRRLIHKRNLLVSKKNQGDNNGETENILGGGSKGGRPPRYNKSPHRLI